MLPRRAAHSLIDARLWLLDTAAEDSVPVDWLTAPNLGEALNRKPHGHSPQSLARTMAQMVRDGEIVLSRFRLDAPPQWGPMAEADVRSIVIKRRNYSYRLTERGGAEWEAWARPQWSRYNRNCSRDNFNVIGAATARVAEQLLELEEYLHDDRAIVSNSIRRKVYRNWRATYWKILPEGHVIAFRSRPVDRGEWAPMSYRAWARWVDARKFYLKPADCGF